jgi:hypothetical protein
MRPIEAVPALFILVLAAGIYAGTIGLRLWDGPTPGARFFPMALSGAGAIIGVLLLLAQRRGFETVEVDFPSALGAIRVAASFAAIIALAVGIPLIGFVPMLALFMLAMQLLVLRCPPVPSVGSAVIVAGLVHIVFIRWLAVPLPMPYGI